METLTSVKFDLTKSTTFYSRAAKWFERRGMDIRDYQDKTITLTVINDGDKVVWAISPNGGKTEMAICFIDLYLQDNPTHKVFVSTHNTIILGNNFYDRVLDKNPTFTHQFVTKDNQIDFTKQVIVSLPSTLNRRKLPKFDLIVIDEAHQMYESDYTPEEGSMVKRIIKKSGIKRELLLTGTPSYFIRKNQEQKKEVYKMLFVPMSKVYDTGACSDVIVEMAGSSYYITDNDYRGDEIKGSFSFKKQETNKTLDDVNQKIYNRIISPIRNSRKYSNKELFKPLSTPLDWSVFRKGLGKTLIACANEPQAKKTAEYYRKNGIDVALSTYKDDKDNKEIERFQKDPNCKILIVVFRGILGFSFNEIENVVDMSLTKNINRMYQLFCRATRKLDGVDKLFIKVIPSDREPHFRVRLTGMLCLMHEEWFSKFNGKNFLELDIPSKPKKGSGSGGGNSNRSKKEPFPMLGLPSMSLLKDLYTKRDELYSPICWSQVGTILRDLNAEVGKRGNITVEVIEDLYKSNEGGLYRDMDIPGNRHIIGKARELKLHDIFIKKYNIQFLHNRTEEKYLPLLDCTSMKDSVDKGLKSAYSRLLATKNSELIEKYIGHFEKLRPNPFTDDDAKEYVDSLIEYPRGVREGHKDWGIYRYVFNRQKEKYYKLILKKFGDMVPMVFLEDEDKLKKVKREIKSCKNYSEWFNKYKSSHNNILTKLNRYDLVDKLPRDVNKKHTKENIIKMLKKYKGKFPNEFRKDHNAEWIWVRKNKLEKELYKDLKHDPRRKQKILIKQN
jgi:superfamily II DNA or RNA helicase